MTQVQSIPNTVHRIAELVEQKREPLIEVSERIWEFAETRYEESRSAELMSAVLEGKASRCSVRQGAFQRRS
ncbi:hypothetical protein LJK88_28380 [Paenibacillus sp. P26]|nr:hypothetical protein LJK88_28380 [Paenibacillus sp. P26]UUZ94756.1 hypothetical protein LJK87_09645 [Paenibacillus sp. P25]